MTLGEKRKVVSFALDRESHLYELALRINFSAFVKRHLAEEYHRRELSQVQSSIQVDLGGDIT